MFKKLIQAIIDKWFCKHEWRVFSEDSAYYTVDDKMPFRVDRTAVCNKCGKIYRETILG